MHIYIYIYYGPFSSVAVKSPCSLGEVDVNKIIQTLMSIDLGQLIGTCIHSAAQPLYLHEFDVEIKKKPLSHVHDIVVKMVALRDHNIMSAILLYPLNSLYSASPIIKGRISPWKMLVDILWHVN